MAQRVYNAQKQPASLDYSSGSVHVYLGNIIVLQQLDIPNFSNRH